DALEGERGCVGEGCGAHAERDLRLDAGGGGRGLDHGVRREATTSPRVATRTIAAWAPPKSVRTKGVGLGSDRETTKAPNASASAKNARCSFTSKTSATEREPALRPRRAGFAVRR